MTAPFMRAYCLHVIKVCHRRGAHAMGGMAAQIPIKNNPAANDEALAKVLADKEREATDGHDGTWVAHPGLVPVALKAFDRHMPGPNQVARQRDDVNVTAADLLAAPDGHDHGGGDPHEPERRDPVPRGVVRGPRLRPALQPDGGRGDRRDLPRPALAVDPQRGEARRTAGR